MSNIWIPGSRVEHGSAVAPTGLKDKLVNEHVIGGPLDPRDVRMYLDKRTLRLLLDIAENSTGGMVEMPRVGLKVKTWEDGHGHNYQTITLISGQPKAAKTPLG